MVLSSLTRRKCDSARRPDASKMVPEQMPNHVSVRPLRRKPILAKPTSLLLLDSNRDAKLQSRSRLKPGEWRSVLTSTSDRMPTKNARRSEEQHRIPRVERLGTPPFCV